MSYDHKIAVAFLATERTGSLQQARQGRTMWVAPGSGGLKASMKRSAIIRKHMMAAKIEERIARGLGKKSAPGH